MSSRLLKVLTVVALVTVSVFSQTSQTGVSLTGGVAIPIGNGSDMINAGFNLDGAFYNNLNPNFSFGGKVGYSRWGIKDVDMGGVSISGSISYIELAPLFRIVGPLNETNKAFFETTFGYFLGFATVKASYAGESMSDTETEGDFGMSLATGVDIGNFQFKPKYTMVFTESESTKWFTISIGFVY